GPCRLVREIASRKTWPLAESFFIADKTVRARPGPTRQAARSASVTARRVERGGTEDRMSTEGDRRAQGATRVPFEALVEVGGALGPSFEAQSVDISEEGMHLRTAYLPDIGQPLTCRFD